MCVEGTCHTFVLHDCRVGGVTPSSRPRVCCDEVGRHMENVTKRKVIPDLDATTVLLCRAATFGRNKSLKTGLIHTFDLSVS